MLAQRGWTWCPSQSRSGPAQRHPRPSRRGDRLGGERRRRKTKSLQGAGRSKVGSVHGRREGKGPTRQMGAKGPRSLSRSIVGGRDPVFPQMTRFGDLGGLCLRARGVRTRARFRTCFGGSSPGCSPHPSSSASLPSPAQPCRLLRPPCISFPQAPPEVEELWCSTQLHSLIPGG